MDTTQTAFQKFISVSDLAREFYPLSSNYVDPGLSKTYVAGRTQFPSGPKLLSLDSRPQLNLRWSLHTWLSLEDSLASQPKQRLLIREHVVVGSQDLTCWALYCKGKRRFIFEYGEHTIISGKATLDFAFETGTEPDDTDEEDPTALTMVALSLNGTHATMFLQGAGEVKNLPGFSEPVLMPAVAHRELPMEMLPTECPGGSILIGDRGVTLAAFEYHPYSMSTLLFHEVEEVGQSLQELAAGIKKPPLAGESAVSNLQMAAHDETQEAVKDSTQDLSTLIRLSGTMAFEAAQSAPGSDGPPANLTGPRADVPWAAAADLSEWRQALATGQSGEVFFDAGALRTGPWALPACGGKPTGAAAGLSEAFQELNTAGISAFTLSWWAKRAAAAPDGGPRQAEEHERLVFRGAEDGAAALKVAFLRGPGLPTNGGWVIQFNGAPSCASGPSADGTCMSSPSFWCQAPGIEDYHSLWRHTAIRFSAPPGSLPSGGEGAIELFLDGVQLCGVSFKLRQELIPHWQSASLSGDGAVVEFCSEGSDAPVLHKGVRLFPTELLEEDLLQLSRDPENQECLDLGLAADNADYLSEFGQGCLDLAAVSSGGSEGVPGGCRLREALENCPISCIHETGPKCFDGIPPKPLEQAGLGAFERIMMWQDEALNATGSSAPSDVFSAHLEAANVAWIPESDTAWHMLFSTVENFPSGDLVYAKDLPDKGPGQHFWVPDHATPESDGWCPGTELDRDLFESICYAELAHDETVNKALSHGVQLQQLNIAYDFQSGKMMRLGRSASMYFWVRKTADEDSNASVTGFDSSGNICFHMTETGVSLFRHGIAESISQGAPEDDQIATLAGGSAHGSRAAGGEWTFFALSISARDGRVLFALDESIAELKLAGLSDGTWGCNSLDAVLNTGSTLLISPIQVSSVPLLPGSIQELYLAERNAFTHLLGPERTHIERAADYERYLRTFASPIVGIAPPVLLQTRKLRYAGTGDSDKCEITRSLSHQLQDAKQYICKHPYECSYDESIVAVPCDSGNQTLSNRFFGHTTKQFKGTDAFPDFAWSLDNEFVIRDSETLIPEFDYIDRDTSKILLLIPFFATQTKVASVLELEMDFGSPKIAAKATFKNVKILSPDELRSWRGWMIAALAVAVLLAVLAFPAAWEETKSLMRFLSKKTSRLRTSFLSKISRTPSDNSVFSFLNPSRYSQDTTQPDLLDVLMFLGLAIFLGVELGLRTDLNDRVQDDFAALAGKDWGDEGTVFDEKIEMFLAKIEDAEYYMSIESQMKMLGFAVLILLGLRIVVFMKFHPRLAAVARTFELIAAEMLNFLFSFGIIFFFLAFTAHVKFGNEFEVFSTLQKALMTQFVVLLAVDLPPFGSNILLTIYLASYVVLCALALLNFFLAIVVNGYTKVQEQALENKVVNSFFKDLVLGLRDTYLWNIKHRYSWPSKVAILKALAKEYPRLFENGYREATSYSEVVMTQDKFHRILAASSDVEEEMDDTTPQNNRWHWIRAAFKGRRVRPDMLHAGAYSLFKHYVKKHPCLVSRSLGQHNSNVSRRDTYDANIHKSDGLVIFKNGHRQA
eukprot:CAMPEP_0177602062 /NCGR_PEP_ID=MMETSP0419_2-20121207/14653_1 /TAXON_ID=582737 /ORGANISM="Tetraselmis sp., Strain GSL018" /LENGTH=1574 /DNA_ID=CAMNT_0019095491 /DNA_START=721 /DNA_END=5445 /DNA_ORIENTATION=-